MDPSRVPPARPPDLFPKLRCAPSGSPAQTAAFREVRSPPEYVSPACLRPAQAPPASAATCNEHTPGADTIQGLMLPSLHDLRDEIRPMFTLAVPVVLAEMGWMTMGMVDALMVGPLGPEAIGAVGLGTSLFMGVVIFGMGLLLGLDTLVSQAFGAGRIEECHRWLVHGVVLALALSLPTAAVLWWMTSALDAWGLNADVLVLSRPYLEILTWSVIPLLLYSAFRRYLQGMGVVRPVMAALISANVINLVLNWVLIYGKWGFPAMGVAGSAWATVFARVVMSITLLAT